MMPMPAAAQWAPLSICGSKGCYKRSACRPSLSAYVSSILIDMDVSLALACSMERWQATLPINATCAAISLCVISNTCASHCSRWVRHNACLGNASPLLIWQCHNYLERVHQVKSLTLAYYIWLTTNLILALWVLVWDGCHVLEAKFCHWRQDLHATKSSTILTLTARMAHSKAHHTSADSNVQRCICMYVLCCFVFSFVFGFVY